MILTNFVETAGIDLTNMLPPKGPQSKNQGCLYLHTLLSLLQPKILCSRAAHIKYHAQGVNLPEVTIVVAKHVWFNML